MKIRNLITAAALAAMPFAAHAATFVVPAAGSGPGANNSQWQSELTLHTSAPRAVSVSIALHQGTSVLGPVSVTLQARETLSIADIVRTKFGVASGNGALVIDVADRDAKTLAVTSRAFNTSPLGEFGQDVPAIPTTSASTVGDVEVITGPSNAANSRFNFGIYAVEATTVSWQLVRANGTIASTQESSYAAGQHAQYTASAPQSVIAVAAQNNDTLHARVLSGRAIFYGSAINATGDPTFIPAMRTREDVRVQFAGVDLDENGTVDVADANGDGVLDSPVTISTLGFPSYFRVVASGEFGETVTFQVASAPSVQADILDASGTLRVAAAGDVAGTTSEIRIRAIVGESRSILIIPVRYR